MFKIPKQKYRAEFKELAVKRLKGEGNSGARITAPARSASNG